MRDLFEKTQQGVYSKHSEDGIATAPDENAQTDRQDARSASVDVVVPGAVLEDASELQSLIKQL